MAHSVLFPLSLQIVSNTHFCHFAWQLRLFRFLKWKSNGILKIMCEMMKKCVAFFFLMCVHYLQYFLVNANIVLPFVVWWPCLFFSIRFVCVYFTLLIRVELVEKWQKLLQAVNINTHVFWSQKTWIICIVNWIICILNAAYFSVARTFEYTVRFVSLLYFLLFLSLSLSRAVFFFCQSIKWNITNRYNILFSSFTFFFDVWCCCNRLVFIYEFILLVAFLLDAILFFSTIHFHHVVEIYFWIHQIGFSLFLSMLHYCWCFCS